MGKIENIALIAAIISRDPVAVQASLKAGADPNDRPDPVTRDPIWLDQLLLNDYDTANKAIYNKIWAMILPLSHVTKRDFMTKRPMFNHATLLQNTEAASMVMLAAIIRTKGVARIAIESLVSSLGEPNCPNHPARIERRDSILAIHALTAQKLKLPQTAFEIDALDAIKTTEDMSYWTDPLSFPALNALPTPAQDYLGAAKAKLAILKTKKRRWANYTKHVVSLANG